MEVAEGGIGGVGIGDGDEEEFGGHGELRRGGVMDSGEG